MPGALICPALADELDITTLDYKFDSYKIDSYKVELGGVLHTIREGVRARLETMPSDGLLGAPKRQGFADPEALAEARAAWQEANTVIVEAIGTVTSVTVEEPDRAFAMGSLDKTAPDPMGEPANEWLVFISGGGNPELVEALR